MFRAFADVPLEQGVRLALRALFERSSTYVVNSGRAPRHSNAPEQPVDDLHREMARRWDEQRALDDLVDAIRNCDAGRAIELTQSPALRLRLARDHAVFAHVLGLM